MPRPVSRAVIGVPLLAAALAVTGCAQGYDGVLWRQMDQQEGVAWGLVAADTNADQLLEALTADDVYWDGRGAAPDREVGAAATIIFGADQTSIGEFDDSVITFDVLVYSGLRPDGIPREKPGSRNGGTYLGPPALYTCYGISATFVADRVRQIGRTHDDGDDRLVCPSALVESLDDGARYERPQEFDG